LFKNRGVITQKTLTKRKIEIKERKQRERERRENLVTY